MVEGDGAVVVVHRDEAALEAALLDRLGGALLRLEGEVVERLAGDAFQRGDGVAADALVRLRVDRAQVGVAGVHERRQAGHAVRRVGRHHVGAAGDDDVLEARRDHAGGEVRRGDAAAAEAVERDAARLDVVAGVERAHAAEVAGLRAGLVARAPDDVVDLGGVEVVALGDRRQHRRGEALRMQVGERTLAGLADAARRAAGVDDQGFRHVVFPFEWHWSSGGRSSTCTVLDERDGVHGST